MFFKHKRRKAQYDLVAKNIITSALTMDEFFKISQRNSAKEKWKVLEVTHEGTEDVKRSRKHSLIQEYELFRMQPEESIISNNTDGTINIITTNTTDGTISIITTNNTIRSINIISTNNPDGTISIITTKKQ